MSPRYLEVVSIPIMLGPIGPITGIFHYSMKYARLSQCLGIRHLMVGNFARSRPHTETGVRSTHLTARVLIRRFSLRGSVVSSAVKDWFEHIMQVIDLRVYRYEYCPAMYGYPLGWVGINSSVGKMKTRNRLQPRITYAMVLTLGSQLKCRAKVGYLLLCNDTLRSTPPAKKPTRKQKTLPIRCRTQLLTRGSARTLSRTPPQNEAQSVWCGHSVPQNGVRFGQRPKPP